MSKVVNSTANGAKKVAKTTTDGAKKVTKKVTKGAKKIEQTVIDQKDTIVQKSALGVAAVLTVTAAANAAPASSGIESVSNENSIVLNNEGQTLSEDSDSTVIKGNLSDLDIGMREKEESGIEGDPFSIDFHDRFSDLNDLNDLLEKKVSPLSTLLNELKGVGKTMLTKQLASWGLDAIGMLFKACGLNFFGGDSPNYVAYFNEINAKLDNIQKTLDEIQTQVSQNEDVRVIDNFYKEFNAIKTSIDPVLTGMADIADREDKGSKAEKEALMSEKVSFYENHVKTLSPGTSFSEKVIALANLVAAPSSNTQQTLMKCFNTVAFDIPGVYTWDVQRVIAQENFLGYVTSTLLKAASVARYEISYQLSVSPASSDQAYWNNADQNLCAALDKALDVLQKDTTNVLNHDSQIRHGIFTHVATGISVNQRMASASFDSKKGHNIFSYGKFEKFTKRSKYSGNDIYIKGFYLHLLVAENDAFYKELAKEYGIYLKYAKKTSDEYTFAKYLYDIGFNISGDLNEYAGLFWKMRFHYREYGGIASLDAVHLNQKADEVGEGGRVGYVTNVGDPDHYEYFKGKGFSNKYFLFLQPGSNYALGSYTRRFVSDKINHHYEVSKGFPHGNSYDDAVKYGTLGFCDPAWDK